MKTTDAIDFVCFGGEDWWYHNRGHSDMQLMRRFARVGTVLYVNSIVMGKPAVGNGKKIIEKLVRKTKSIFRGLKNSGVGFWVYSPFALPVHHISWARPFNQAMLQHQIHHVMGKLNINNPIVWIVNPVACDTALNIGKKKLVYQRTDRYEDYPDVDVETITAYDRKLKEEADMTVFVNTSLYNEEAGQCKNAFFLDHGVDYEMFVLAESNHDIPAEMADIKRPIIGYVGGIADHKVDIDFMNKVIELLPTFSFVIVGDAPQKYRDMFIKDNVKFLGKQPYERIPYYGKCFDVALLPWKINKWTEAANPIKLKEYLALGKPIVSTSAFSEIQQYLDVVHVADTPKEFSQHIMKAVSENGPDYVAMRRKRVMNSSWDSKAETVLRKLLQ